MTRAKTVASQAKDSALSMETSFTSSTPRMMNGGRRGGSLWREIARRWELYPARGGECCLLLPTSLAMMILHFMPKTSRKNGESRGNSPSLIQKLEEMIFTVKLKELRLFNFAENKPKRWLNYRGLATPERKGEEGERAHHLLKSFGRKRNNQNPSLEMSSEFEVEHMF